MVDARSLKSGEFRSRYNLFRSGRYEVSMRAPTAESNFVLSMFSFRTPHYQEWREIDFELVADLPASLSTNVIIGMNMQGYNPLAEEPARAYPFGAQPAMALPAGFACRACSTRTRSRPCPTTSRTSSTACPCARSRRASAPTSSSSPSAR